MFYNCSDIKWLDKHFETFAALDMLTHINIKENGAYNFLSRTQNAHNTTWLLKTIRFFFTLAVI